MNIRINALNPDSIAEAIAKIRAYESSLERKANEIAERLANLGAQVVEYAYQGSEDEYEVSCITNGNSSMIIAEGDGVIFLEFGTGVYTEDHTYEMESEGLPPIFAGSYSQTEGTGQFRPGHEYWYHDHTRYVGTIPMRGFYMASKEIQEQAVEIAKKVFKK